MVALVALMPQTKARKVLFHCGESSGGSLMGAHVRDKAAPVNRHCGPAALHKVQPPPLPPHEDILQHEACPARLADTVAELVGLGAGVGADTHLVEHVGAAA